MKNVTLLREKIGTKSMFDLVRISSHIENISASFKYANKQLILADLPDRYKYEEENGEIFLVYQKYGQIKNYEYKFFKSLVGTYTSLFRNVVEGFTKGYSKILRIKGVNYKAELDGRELILKLGYCHPVIVMIPDTISLKLESANQINLHSHDKQAVGMFASQLCKIKKFDVYKGTGVFDIAKPIKLKEIKKTKS